jgi:hypothetical protein
MADDVKRGKVKVIKNNRKALSRFGVSIAPQNAYQDS